MTMNVDQTILDHPNFERQLELEEKMRSLGIKRFRDSLDRAVEDDAYSETHTGTRLVSAAHERMVKAIEEFMAEASSGKAGRKHTAIKYLKMLNDHDVAANLTARCVLDGLIRSPHMSSVASNIGQMIQDEVNSRIFKAEMPRAFKKFHEKAKKETLARRKWSHLLFPARLLGVELVKWDDKEKLLLGTKLIELFVAATGMVTCTLISEDGGRITGYKLEAKQETLAWVEEENNRLEGLFPVYLPMVVPPKPWTSPFDGGYYSRVINSLKLVKTHNKAYLRELAERDLNEVYGAVNALQETAWQVNTRVLAVMEQVYNTSSEIGGTPSFSTLRSSAPASG